MMNGRLDLHIDEYDEWKRKEEHLEEHDKQLMNMKNVDEQSATIFRFFLKLINTYCWH
jgi:hypothetical protein